MGMSRHVDEPSSSGTFSPRRILSLRLVRWFELDWHAAGSSETALTVMATRLGDIEEGLRVIEAAVSPGRRMTKSK